MAILISNNNEVREMVNETLQLNVSVRSKNRIMSTDNRNLLSFGIITNNTQQKRHIMISYNRSSIKICRKIYNRLVERNYKVWMDLENMFDDVLVAKARAVENSYIILLCINQQYYESDYCRLEAEYAAEKRIKLIPCLMEEAFHPKSWLGIIKGSNVHIDFSSPDDFNKSFEQLIRQINFIENKLSLHPRHIDEQFINRTFEQNELLIKLIDRLTRQKSLEKNRRHNFNVNSLIKTVLTIVLIWLLITYCQKQ